MVRIRTQLKVPKGAFDKIGDIIKRRISKANRQALSETATLINEGIDEAVEKNRRKLIPSLDDAGELGIGANGSVDDERRTQAWEGLKTGNGATTFGITKIGEEKGGIVQEIKITIDESTFYNQELARIPTPDTDAFAPAEIPWMRWFVEGQTISGARFSSRKRNFGASRTGRGIMISGGLWTFRPKGQGAFNKILDDARKAINRNLKKGLGAAILRRIR